MLKVHYAEQTQLKCLSKLTL